MMPGGDFAANWDAIFGDKSAASERTSNRHVKSGEQQDEITAEIRNQESAVPENVAETEQKGPVSGQ